MTVSYPGECNQCQTMCLAIYQPICSTDSAGNEKTWGSECEFNSYNCRYPNDRKSFDYLAYASIKPFQIFPKQYTLCNTKENVDRNVSNLARDYLDQSAPPIRTETQKHSTLYAKWIITIANIPTIVSLAEKKV